MQRIARLVLLVAALGLGWAGRGMAGPADSSAMDWSRVPEYRLVPGDVLRFNFGPPAGFTGDVIRESKIRIDGRVSVFPVGDVIAAGRTVKELQTAVIELMSAEYRFPRVTVEVFEPAGNRVHVLGRVKIPGSYPALPFMTVSQAVAAASGFEDDASRNAVLVFHRDGASSVRVERVELDKALKRADLDADPVLSRFDIVYVPRSGIGNLEVFTRQFFGSTGLALQSAIAGWELFNLDRVFVLR